MGWSGSGSRAPPAGAIDCLRNGVSSYPCFLLTVLFGLTALPLVWVVRDSRCSPGVLHGSGTGRPGGFRWRGQKKIGGGRPSRQFRNCQSWRRCNALASAWSGVIPDGAYCNRSSTAADGDPLRAASCCVTPAWHGFLTLNMYWVLGTCVRGHLLSFSACRA